MFNARHEVCLMTSVIKTINPCLYDSVWVLDIRNDAVVDIYNQKAGKVSKILTLTYNKYSSRFLIHPAN